VRLIEPGFEVYSYQTLTRTARYKDGAFTHVTDQPGYSFLLVGDGPSLVYYQANPRLTPLGHLHAIGPFTIWADHQDRERVWVHYLKDDAVHHFALPRDVERAGALLGTVALANFTGTLLARLTAGQWVYASNSESGGGAQLRLVDGTRTAWLGGIPAQAEAAVPGAGIGLWLLSTRQAMAFELSPLDHLMPRGAVDLPSEPWAATSAGERLAVLSQEVKGTKRHWSVQVVEAGRPFTPLALALNEADEIASLSRLSMCLAPDRPWVVVGSPRGLQVIDYTTGEALLVR
jgi:hypothetical protein